MGVCLAVAARRHTSKVRLTRRRRSI